MARGKNTKGKRQALLYFVFATILISACSRHEAESSRDFDSYYPKFQLYSYAEYDSLLNYYYCLDSLTRDYSSDLMQYLKKMTESRLSYRAGDYAKSNIFIDEALISLKSQSTVDSLNALCFLCKGINFMMLAEYDSAFHYFHQAEKQYETLKHSVRLCTVYGNMAKASYNKGDFDKTTAYINQAGRDSTYLPLLLSMAHLKANLYGRRGLLDSALIIDREMIRRYGKEEYKLSLSSFYNNMAVCFLEKNQTDSAIFYFHKSYQTDSICGFQVNMAVNLVLLANIYYQTGHSRQADYYYQKAIDIFSRENSPDKKALVFNTLAANAANENNYKLALQWKDSIIHIQQKINNIDINRTIERLNIEYESDKKMRQIAGQQRQLSIQRIIIALIVAIMLLMIALFLLYVQIKKKAAALRIVEQDKNVMSMLIGMEKNERSRIARELHDSVNQKLAVIQMYISSLKSVDSDQVKEISGLVKEASLEIRTISRNMAPKDLNKGLIPALENFCDQCNFMQKQTQFHLKVKNAGPALDQDEISNFVLYRIVQEISNNALKYAEAENINILLEYTPQEIILKIDDDGRGFDTAILKETKGMGLNNIFDRVKQLKGKVELLSDLNKGTTFNIIIPRQ